VWVLGVGEKEREGGDGGRETFRIHKDSVVKKESITRCRKRKILSPHVIRRSSLPKNKLYCHTLLSHGILFYFPQGIVPRIE
jgi:hypothetical protein